MKYFVSQRAPWTMDNLPDVAVGQNYQLCWPDPAPDTAIILTISVSPDQKDIQIKKTTVFIILPPSKSSFINDTVTKALLHSYPQ